MKWRFGNMWVITFVLVHQVFAAQAVTEFPCEYDGGLVWVQVTTDTADKPLHFILDSGATVSVLDLQTVTQLKVRKGQRVQVKGVGSEQEGYWPQRLQARIGNIVLPKNYLAVDLNCLSKACHRRIDGLLGSDFIKGRMVQIDYAAQKIRVLPKGPPMPVGETLPLRFSRGAMHIQVRVNDCPPKWVRLDTGCASALQWISPGLTSAPDESLVSIGLVPVKVPMIRAKVQLGRESFDFVPIGVHPQEIFHGEAGLLGNGLLSRFQVTIDGVNKRLILRKNLVDAP